MKELQEVLNKIALSDDYSENASVVNYLMMEYRNEKNPVSDEDCEIFTEFLRSEMNRIIELIPQAPDYKAKDVLFSYEDRLLGMFTIVYKDRTPSNEDIDLIKKLVETVSSEQIVETAVLDMFALKKITEADVDKMTETVRTSQNKYERGMVFNSLLNKVKEFNKFDAQAKTAMGAYLSAEMQNYVLKGELDEDEKNALEIAVDVCRHFMSKDMADVLLRVLKLDIPAVNYFAVGTLLKCGYGVPQNVINDLAHNLRYAYLLFYTLAENKKDGLFPKELLSDEYLAKSDMVQWLAYPTELNQEPDEIELLGKTKIKGEIYHIFKYKSNSENLTDDLVGQWLIGWSSTDGGTFSDFDLLSEYEQKTPEKTVKYIAKKLLK